ncbi:ribonuclease H-like domain-containing protein [Tanacetum coccineum]
MDLETTQTNDVAKLPLLKQENGNSFNPVARTTTNADGTSTSTIPGLITTEEKSQKKNDVKSRSMLLMAHPNEHQLTFNQYKDAKTLFAAIQTRFGGNDATKKTQKTILKQIYENFNAPSTESLDSIFNRLQKIVSQLAILGENISQEDLNLKFLRISTANSSVSTASTHDNTANLTDATVYAFLANQPNGSQLVHEDLEQIHKDDLEEIDLKWQLALLSMRARRYYQRTGKKITINGSDTAGYDKSKVECFNCHKMGHFARECKGPKNPESRARNQDSSRRTVNVKEIASKAMVAIDGAGFDWSYMADEEVPTNMALMDFSDFEVNNDKTCSNTCLKSFEALKTQLDNLSVEFNKFEFNLATYKKGLASVEEQLVFYKKNEVMFCDQIVVLKRDALFKDSEINALKIEIEKLKNEKESNQIKINKFENASKSLDKLIGSQILDNNRKGVGYNVIPPPPTGLFAPLVIDLSYSGTSNEVKTTPATPLVEELVSEKETQTAHCKYHQREGMAYGNNYNRVNYNYTTNITHPNAQKNKVPRAVLMKTGVKPFNTAKKVNTAQPKSIVYSSKPMPKAVNTARPNSAVVNTVRANQANAIKASACWVWRPTKPDSASITLKKHNYIDAQGISKSVISRSLMEDMLPLVEESEEERSLVKMCDKKNCVLFTNTACFVLSSDFKLPNESQILLKIPRKNNMYSVDMKNIVPKESLTCLVAKATLDELILWHRRLGHINFKTINKLVKDNLVRASKDEICGILKNFITEIENLVDKKVKIIRRDNGTEFKNRVMKEFCEQEGIKREYSVARTP